MSDFLARINFPGLNAGNQIARPFLIGAKLIFWPLAFLTLMTLAMQLGLWQRKFDIAGPFAAETDPPRHSLMLAVPREGPAVWWRQPLIGDTGAKPFESRLELQINGRSMGPPHAWRETIRRGKTEGFSHSDDLVIFALPPGAENAASTTATLRYSVEPRPWITLALLVLTAPLCWLLYRRPLARHASFLRRAERPATMVMRATYAILFGLCCVGLTGAAIFLASSIYAFAEGWALPTTALVRWWPAAEWAAINEPDLGYLLLTLAGLGALTTWVGGLSQTGRPYLECNESRLPRFLYWSGFPIAACAYALSLSAMWSGLVRPGDFDYANIGGLIPFSDANGHLASSFDQARDGTWGSFAMRRPFAAAFRSVLLLLGQYSFPQMLLLQACLLGGATWFASYAVMVWRGVWSGVGFFALTYIYARIFAPTSLTEPLGIFWALLSVPFFIDAFRSGSERSALVGFAMTAFALMTRMGNMFAIPALLVWLVWQFGQGVAAKARIGLISIAILVGVFGLNTLLEKAYGSGNGSTGSNFSFVLCGLTLGTTWEGCPKKLEAEGSPALPENVQAAKMYSMALQNLRTRPGVFLNRFKDAVSTFYSRFPSTIWKGYGEGVDEPKWFYRSALVALLVVGISFVVVQRSTWPERTFWLLLWASLTVSAGFVYFDDGARVLAASYPMIAMFIATGLATPLPRAPDTTPDRRLALCGSIGLFIAAALLAGVPWISHRLTSGYAAAVPEGPTEDAFVFGGKRMSGFLVIANGDPLRSDIPTIHLSDFEDIVYQSGVEDDQGLLHPIAPPLPFGFAFAPRTEKGAGSWYLYIVPADVMERPDVPIWHFKFEPWHHKPNLAGNYWFYVTDAEPWPMQER